MHLYNLTWSLSNAEMLFLNWKNQPTRYNLFILQNRCREQTQIINSKCSRVHQAVRKLGEMLNAIFKPKSTEATDEDSVLGILISRSFTNIPVSSRGFENFMWTFQVGGVRCLERWMDTLRTIQIKINSYVNLKRYEGFLVFFLTRPCFYNKCFKHEISFRNLKRPMNTSLQRCWMRLSNQPRCLWRPWGQSKYVQKFVCITLFVKQKPAAKIIIIFFTDWCQWSRNQSLYVNLRWPCT